MSLTFKLTTVDGEIEILTLQGLRNRLDGEEACRDALTAYARDGRAHVTLRNGVPALITHEHDHVIPAQGRLPDREFSVNCTLLIPIPGHARVRAGSPAEAAHIVQEVLGKQTRTPTGFSLEIASEDVAAFIDTLDYSMPRDPQSLEIASAVVNHVHEVRLLEAAR